MSRRKLDELPLSELCAPLSAKVESTRASWAHEVLGGVRDEDKNDLVKRRRASTYWQNWHAARRAQKKVDD